MSRKEFYATEPAKVQTETHGAVVTAWLRKNITEDTADDGPDGEGRTFWSADEATGRFDAPLTAEEIEADFDSYWDACEAEGKTIAERVSETETATAANAETVNDLAAGFAELVDVVFGGE